MIVMHPVVSLIVALIVITIGGVGLYREILKRRKGK